MQPILREVGIARQRSWIGGAEAAALVGSLLAAALLGWLLTVDAKLGLLFALAACAAPLALSAGLSARGWAIALALAGHLVAGPLYIHGLVSSSFALLLDALVVFAFLALAFQPRSPARAWRVATLAFVGLMAIEAFNPLLPSFGYGMTGARSFIVPFLLLVAVGSGRLERRDERVLLTVGVIGWIVNVLLAGRQLIFGFTGAELQWIESSNATFLVGEQVRLLGATRSNQDFAFLVAIAFPAVIAAVLARRRGPRWRLGFGLLAVATVVVLVGSLVRSGLVAGVVGAIAVLAVMARDRVTQRRLLVSAAALAVVLWLVASFGLRLVLPEKEAATVSDRVTSIFAPSQDYAFQQRETVVWPHAVHEIGAHPLGAGAGSAGPLSQTREDAPLGPLVPDNGYLLVAVQFGIVGLALFVSVLILLAVELWRRARRGAVIAAAGFGAVLALIVAMATGNFVSLVSPSCAWAVLLGLGLRAPASR